MAWVTVNQWTPNKGRNNWYGVTLRQVMQASTIASAGDKIRLTFKAPASIGLRVASCFVGKVEGTDPAGAPFMAEPVRVTFDSGDNGFTSAAGDLILSDEIDFVYDPADGDAIVVSWFVPNDGAFYGSSVARAAVSGTSLHYVVGNFVDAMPGEMDGNIFYFDDEFTAMSVVKTELEATNNIRSNIDLEWDVETTEPALAEVSKFTTYALSHAGDFADMSKFSVNSVVIEGTLASVSKLAIYIISTEEVLSNLSLLWDSESEAVESELDLLWDVSAGAVTSTQTFLWDDAAALVPFIRTFDFKWDVGGPVVSSQTFLWNDLDGTPVVKNIDFKWNVFNDPVTVNYIVSSVVFQWDMSQSYVDPSRVVYPDIPILETWDFKTSVFRSRSGKEQRRAYVRDPVVSMQYSALILDNKGFRDLRKAVEVDTTAFYPVPQFQYYAHLTQPASPGDTRLYFDPTEVNPVVGANLAICNSDTMETIFIEIAAIHMNGATLVSSVGINIDTEIFFVSPVRMSRISTDGNSKLAPVHAQSTYIFVSVDRDINFLRFGAAPTFDRIDGRIILDRPIVANTNINEDYLSGNDVLDNGIGVPLLYVNEPTRRRFDLVYQINRLGGADAITWWRAFALETCGQWKTFLLPTYRADADLLAEPALGSATITLIGKVTYDVFTQGGYGGLMFDTENGREYRGVTSVALAGDDTIVTLASPLGGSAGDNIFDAVSYLMITRLSEDRITVNHGATTREIQFKAQMTVE